MKRLAILMLVILCSSCGTAGQLFNVDPVGKLIRQFQGMSMPDLVEAKKTSTKANDMLALPCWNWLIDHPIDTTAFDAKVNGAASAIAKKRAIMLLAEQYRSPASPLRVGLMTACGPVVADEERSLLNIRRLIGGGL